MRCPNHFNPRLVRTIEFLLFFKKHVYTTDNIFKNSINNFITNLTHDKKSNSHPFFPHHGILLGRTYELTHTHTLHTCTVKGGLADEEGVKHLGDERENKPENSHVSVFAMDAKARMEVRMAGRGMEKEKRGMESSRDGKGRRNRVCALGEYQFHSL